MLNLQKLCWNSSSPRVKLKLFVSWNKLESFSKDFCSSPISDFRLANLPRVKLEANCAELEFNSVWLFEQFLWRTDFWTTLSSMNVMPWEIPTRVTDRNWLPYIAEETTDHESTDGTFVAGEITIFTVRYLRFLVGSWEFSKFVAQGA